MWGAFGADRWNFIVIVFNYSATVKAFVIYLTELLCVACEGTSSLLFTYFFFNQRVIKCLEMWIGSFQCSVPHL